ncbi:hypothetical protein ANO11243_007260 [Dothideomycetidae sp. 11243]|nr:hypothetical protein ANO11243_007260 [fungal sp. No.11243]
MFGAFRPTSSLSVGLLWKIPWRLSAPRKLRHRRRLRRVDNSEDSLIGEVRTTSQAAHANGTIKLLERWKADMPSEQDMVSRDKYTIFDRKERGYRKGIHKLPKWTRVSQRLNPPGF